MPRQVDTCVQGAVPSVTLTWTPEQEPVYQVLLATKRSTEIALLPSKTWRNLKILSGFRMLIIRQLQKDCESFLGGENNLQQKSGNWLRHHRKHHETGNI